VVSTLGQVVAEADVVLSVVPPGAAEEVAWDYVKVASLWRSSGLYVDLNSIGPDLTGALARRIEQAGGSFVDGAVNGLAKNLETGGTLFVSGARSMEVAKLFEGIVRVQNLGPRAGAASMMKMLLSGMSKGVCGLFIELAVAAQRQGMLHGMMEATGQIYPGIMDVVLRMLPTYVHGARRRWRSCRGR
jgi:3-hydroxyisobutyrate dehydrogenase-like beta-hydroxyacid dehydrogenase